MLDRFFFKYQTFKWGREFRLAISGRMVEEFGVLNPADSIFVNVDLSALVDRIVLSSTTTAGERTMVIERIRQMGLGDRLELSTLLGKPHYV